ncbi:MAG: TlpA family protein disulfide reductase [Pseudomonadales bacterium]
MSFRHLLVTFIFTLSCAVHASDARPPQFTLLDDSTSSIETYRGKFVLLNFWASWCGPCREELPSMNALWAQLNTEEITMLAVNFAEDLDTVKRFTARYPIHFPVVRDPQLTFTKFYQVNAMPTTVLLNREGVVIETIIGAKDWAAPEIVDKILALTRQ